MNNHLKIFYTKIQAKISLKPKKTSYAAHYIRLVARRRVAEFLFSTLLILGGQQFIPQHLGPVFINAGKGVPEPFRERSLRRHAPGLLDDRRKTALAPGHSKCPLLRLFQPLAGMVAREKVPPAEDHSPD